MIEHENTTLNIISQRDKGSQDSQPCRHELKIK